MSQEIINTLRALSIDMINKANSGHPGMPMGAAPIGHTIYKNMNIDPKRANWFNRDRFVLAAGHASALLYSLLHVNGFDVNMDDLKNFRQLNSRTPGHPELGHTAGVDATSGPLGQGLPMAVGMAVAEAFLSEKYNRDHFNIVDHYTYVLCSDGEMHEGVASEASSLAGHLGLGKLIVFYDSNDITLDGDLSASFSDDVKKRYESYNWQYLIVEDGNDTEELNRALAMAKLDHKRPTIIEVKTVIGYGCSKAGSSATHGAPIGKEEALIAKEAYNHSNKEFFVSKEVEEYTNNKVANGNKLYRAWTKQLAEYKNKYPKLAEEFELVINNKYSVDFKDYDYKEVGFNQATRNSSNDCINYIAKKHPTFIGGSADLSKSCMTDIKDESAFTKNNYSGRILNYGIREFAMSAINNGITIHGGVKVFGATFFVFSDYMKPAVKMAALMKIPTIFVFTHDSIAVGEDGPTHEPIEHLAMFRSMPNVNVLRPCDANETAAAWQIALESKETPTVLVLSRQNLDVETNSTYENVSKGAYIAYPEKNNIDCLLIATGSEVNLAIKAAKQLEKENIDVRVVSMPSMNIFEKQTAKYQKEVIPNSVKKRLSIEMLSSFGWHKYALKDSQILSVDIYGASAPGNVVIDEYGFNVDNVVNKVKTIVK